MSLGRVFLSGKELVGIISVLMVSSVLGFVILDKNHEEQSKDLRFSEQEEVQEIFENF